MKRLFRQTLFSLLLAVVLTSALFGGASAQAGFALSINLPRTETAVGGQAAVSVVVSDAVNLNAFDIELTYDPQVLTLTNWGFGSFLTNWRKLSWKMNPGAFTWWPPSWRSPARLAAEL